MTDITTIKLRRETKKRLDRLKEYERESYEEVLRKILFILNLSRKNPEKSGAMFRRLDAAVKRKVGKYVGVYHGGEGVDEGDDEVDDGGGVVEKGREVKGGGDEGEGVVGVKVSGDRKSVKVVGGRGVGKKVVRKVKKVEG